MQGIAYWIEKRAYITPERTALIGEQQRLTYKEMSANINKMACALSEQFQVQPGDRIAIIAQNGTEYIQLLFAIAKLGCIAVPLNTRLSPKELQFQLNDSESSVIIVGSDYYKMGQELKSTCRLKHLVLLENTVDRDDLISFSKIYSSYPSYYSGTINTVGSLPFIICYTSGTTGQPKGAVLTQDHMFWNAMNNILAIDISSNDQVLTLLPLFHIGGIGLFTFPALLAGATVIIPQSFNPQQTLKLIENEKASIVMGVPTIFNLLRKNWQTVKPNVDSVRWFISGGAPCPQELIRFYHEQGISFGQGYGMTETSPTVFMLPREDIRRKTGSIGKPVMFCDFKIVNGQDQDVSPGVIGELLVKGQNVINEYWKNPNETVKSFKEGWLRTGDLARVDDEGFVYIAGRKKEMIISGGENIYPLEIEQILEKNPAIAEIAVIGVPDNKWGEVPLAILSLKNGFETSDGELMDYCLARLAKYKCPQRFEMINELPKNATGKIDKVSLKRKYSTI